MLALGNPDHAMVRHRGVAREAMVEASSHLEGSELLLSRKWGPSCSMLDMNVWASGSLQNVPDPEEVQRPLSVTSRGRLVECCSTDRVLFCHIWDLFQMDWLVSWVFSTRSCDDFQITAV